MFVCVNVFVGECVCEWLRVCKTLYFGGLQCRPTRLVFPIFMYFVFARQIDSLGHANWE